MSPDGIRQDPLRVIVSGGIGSGKSTVLGVLESLGAVVIEADRIGHEVLAPEGPAFAAVAERWPQVVVAGRIDRSRLAAIVFNDADELAALEAISHPLIGGEIANRVAAAGDRDVALELPLNSELAGPGWTRIIVDAPAAVRVERSVDRGMIRDDVENRLQAQPDREVWLEAADVVIENTGTLAELEEETRAVWRRLQLRR